MTAAARTRAKRCFALARSTPFPAERTSAIARGEAICAKAGLSLDDFDIPGRLRLARPSAAQSRIRAVYFESVSDTTLAEVFARMAETLKQAEERAGVRDGETLADAQLRNFNAACAEAAERDRARGRAA